MSSDLARILVPTDSTPSSDGAVTLATKLADKFGASLHLIDVPGDWSTREFATVAMIVQYAATHAIDLIVIGTEGQGAPGDLGRVVEAVVRLGSCPVLTVKRESSDEASSVLDAGRSASTFV